MTKAYVSDKPAPDDWVELFEEDEDFRNESNQVFSSNNIPEADEKKYAPEVFDDTYVNIEVAFPRDGEGPEFAKVTKRLRDTNGLPIGTANNNPIPNTRLYEVEYLDGHTALL